MSRLGNAVIVLCIIFLVAVTVIVLASDMGIDVIPRDLALPSFGDSGATPQPAPPTGSDPIIGLYQSGDGTTLSRFYGNGTFLFEAVNHPSKSFGSWTNTGDGHYSLRLTMTEVSGTVTDVGAMPFGQSMGLEMRDGGLASSSSGDFFSRVSASPDDVIATVSYRPMGGQTPIQRQVGVTVARTGPGRISVTVLSGQDVPSLVTLHVFASGQEIQPVSGNIGPHVGSVAYYDVPPNTDIGVVGEFYDYSQYPLWSGMI